MLTIDWGFIQAVLAFISLCVVLILEKERLKKAGLFIALGFAVFVAITLLPLVFLCLAISSYLTLWLFPTATDLELIGIYATLSALLAMLWGIIWADRIRPHFTRRIVKSQSKEQETQKNEKAQ